MCRIFYQTIHLSEPCQHNHNEVDKVVSSNNQVFNSPAEALIQLTNWNNLSDCWKYVPIRIERM